MNKNMIILIGILLLWLLVIRPLSKSSGNKQELPENEGIDLRQSADMPLEDLKCSLLYPLERCKYCIEGKLYDWEVIGKNSKLEDWIEQDYA